MNKSKDFSTFAFVFSVCLEAADNVLIERAAGKRIDPKTKGIVLKNFILVYLIKNIA
jgi:hypothetical protein